MPLKRTVDTYLPALSQCVSPLPPLVQVMVPVRALDLTPILSLKGDLVDGAET